MFSGLSSKLLDKRHRADPLKVEAFNEPLSLVDDGIEEKTVKKDEGALKDLFEGKRKVWKHWHNEICNGSLKEAKPS